tara:strand:- start:221 stop:853 length:633 start_codon:yes stop_codon:yes gene_type:complete
MSFITSLFSQKTKTFFKKFRKFNALNNLDKKMLRYMNFKNGFFIECGANDGVDQSNTWYYEKYLNWNGVLIEPLIKQFNELKKNRSKKNKFYNTVLSSSVSVHSLNLTKNNLVSRIVDHNKSEINFVTVSSTTLTKILDEIYAPSLIDFFSLDVEGYEYEIIKGIDFNKYNFKYFLIETSNELVISYLKQKNYRLLNKLTFHDLLFKYEI